MTDVGDAVQLTFSTTTGATVTAEVTSPDATTTSPVSVPETGTSGNYPFTFVPDAAGVWQVVFRSTSPTAVEAYQVTANAVPAAPLLASPDDVAELWRALSTEETALARTLIRYASAILRRRVTDLDARVASGDVGADLVALVVARMVLRVMQSPAGGVKSQTVGPYSVTYDTAAAARHLVLDPDDLALLAPVPSTPTSPVGSIRLRPGLHGASWWL